MNSRIDPTPFVQFVRQRARKASRLLPPHSPAYRQALNRIRRPVDYMRCAEFPLALEQLSLQTGTRVLDVASPQWFSLYLATQFPQTQFLYVNLLVNELEQIREVSGCLGIQNIHYHECDVRSLPFDSEYFDRVVSLSAIEHVGPENGGDALALKEIHRVLAPHGTLTLSVPLKQVRNVMYSNRPVYDRVGTRDNFFAREYDLEQFLAVIDTAGFQINKKALIIEQPGLGALDDLEWGRGRKRLHGKYGVFLVRAIEKYLNIYLEDKFAIRYLRVASEITYRPVNIVATLAKADPRQ
jgi:SAM-dependent methyltransferase